MIDWDVQVEEEKKVAKKVGKTTFKQMGTLLKIESDLLHM